MSEPDLNGVTDGLAAVARALCAAPAPSDAERRPRLELDGSELRDRAKKLDRTRRRRAAIFRMHDHLFGDAAWDLLVELFLAHAEGRVLDSTSLCIGADLPLATGLRYVAALADAGLARRSTDPRDRRRSMTELTELGIDLMTRFVTEA